MLRDVTFRAESGRVHAIVGPNGAVRTTLLRCLAGLTPIEGQVRTSDGRPPDLFWVAQNPDLQIFNASVEEELNSVEGTSDLRDWVMEAFRLRSCATRPSLLLSEGQKERLILGVALLREPQHGLLLDEPSLGQGPADKRILGNLASACAEMGHIVVVATHDIEFVARHADWASVLDGGKIVADGPASEVLADNTVLAEAGICAPQTPAHRSQENAGKEPC